MRLAAHLISSRLRDRVFDQRGVPTWRLSSRAAGTKATRLLQASDYSSPMSVSSTRRRGAYQGACMSERQDVSSGSGRRRCRTGSEACRIFVRRFWGGARRLGCTRSLHLSSHPRARRYREITARN